MMVSPCPTRWQASSRGRVPPIITDLSVPGTHNVKNAIAAAAAAIALDIPGKAVEDGMHDEAVFRHPVGKLAEGTLHILQILEEIQVLDIPGKAVEDGMRDFRLPGRRFEYKGTFHGAELCDDYAHHPR